MTKKEKFVLSFTAEERSRYTDALWNETRECALGCSACPLGSTRINVVFGEGNPKSSLVFIGEGPGADEDAQGRPFVGRAGQLLNQILTAAGIKREEVYITNIVKCRPPGNRVPTPSEATACMHHLDTQLLLINPKLIVLLGNTPLRWILQCEGITKMRGRWFEWHGTAVMPMFHPSYLLRNQSREIGSPKQLTWLDIQEVKRQWDNFKANGDFRTIKFG